MQIDSHSIDNEKIISKPRPVKVVRRAFEAACRRAKIKNLHFHDLRHTVGSRLISRGADPVSVKNILGHANLKTTEIYLHSSLQQMTAAVEKLNPKPAAEPQKAADLLHIRDTRTKKDETQLATDSYSIN